MPLTNWYVVYWVRVVELTSNILAWLARISTRGNVTILLSCLERIKLVNLPLDHVCVQNLLAWIMTDTGNRTVMSSVSMIFSENRHSRLPRRLFPHLLLWSLRVLKDWIFLTKWLFTLVSDHGWKYFLGSSTFTYSDRLVRTYMLTSIYALLCRSFGWPGPFRNALILLLAALENWFSPSSIIIGDALPASAFPYFTISSIFWWPLKAIQSRKEQLFHRICILDSIVVAQVS